MATVADAHAKNLPAALAGSRTEMKEVREKAGLSQAQLAARVGTQAPGIARIESGRFAPRLDVLHRIAAALGRRVRIQFDRVGASSTERDRKGA